MDCLQLPISPNEELIPSTPTGKPRKQASPGEDSCLTTFLPTQVSVLLETDPISAPPGALLTHVWVGLTPVSGAAVSMNSLACRELLPPPTPQ